MMNRPLIFRILPVMVSLFLFSCGKVQQPEFKGIENLEMDKFGFSQSTFTLDLHYYNPNRSGIKLKEAEGDAWLDGKLLGHFIMDTLITIKGNSDFRLPVSFKVEMNQLFKNSLAAMLGKESVLKVEGKAKVGKSGVYIRYPIRYEGKHNLGELLK